MHYTIFGNLYKYRYKRSGGPFGLYVWGRILCQKRTRGRIMNMESAARSVSWEAPEHTHGKKGGDWFLALGIITVAVVIAAILLDNFLFALLAALSGASMAVAVSQPPRIVAYEVNIRGIRIGDTVYPFANLRSYYLQEDDPRGPQLLVMAKKTLTPLLILPIPEEYMDEIEEIMAGRLPEEFLEEPLLHKILEIFGL